MLLVCAVDAALLAGIPGTWCAMSTCQPSGELGTAILRTWVPSSRARRRSGPHIAARHSRTDGLPPSRRPIIYNAVDLRAPVREFAIPAVKVRASWAWGTDRRPQRSIGSLIWPKGPRHLCPMGLRVQVVSRGHAAPAALPPVRHAVLLNRWGWPPATGVRKRWRTFPLGLSRHSPLCSGATSLDVAASFTSRRPTIRGFRRRARKGLRRW
jgi:hypothetical protein